MMMMVKVSQNTNVKNDEMKEKRIYPNPIASKNDWWHPMKSNDDTADDWYILTKDLFCKDRNLG